MRGSSPSLLRRFVLLAVAAVVFCSPRTAAGQEKTISLSFTKELLYNIARDNEGEMTDQIVGRLKGLSPSVESVRIIRSGGEVTLYYTVIAGDDLEVSFSLTLEKMAFYRMAAAREDIDGMLQILKPARAREPLILELSYRYNEHYSIVDLLLDLRPAIEAKEEEMKKAAAALAPPPPPPPEEPKRQPERKKPEQAKPKKAEGKKVEAKKAEEKKHEEKKPEPPPPPAYLSAAPLGKSPVPTIDGSPDDKAWSKATPFSFEVTGKSGNVKVTAAALWGGGAVYFLLRWPDQGASTEHRPWKWSSERGEYVAGSESEDGLALQFSPDGRLGDCMLSGREAEGDLWFWRAARTDPVGFAEDGTLTVSLQRIPKANFQQARNGRTVWIKETRDAGTGPYRTQVAGPFEGEQVRRYIPREPSGSAADVRAKGQWEQGAWTVELTRSLSTGDEGDAVFKPGKEHYFSVAVFNGRERGEHSSSKEHLLKLE